MDRAEWTGTGAALLFHVALIGAMSMSLAQVAKMPEPPAMEVEFADEVALQSAAPATIATPPPAAQAPDLGPPDPVETPPSPPLPSPTPTPAAKPQPSVKPRPSVSQTRPTPARQQPAARGPRLGSDFLKGIGDDLAPKTATGKPAAATFSAAAKMNVGQAIINQAKPCADSQAFIGEGANRLRLTVNLQFSRNGRLLRPPLIRAVSGDADLKSKYGDLLEDQVQRIFSQCAPFRLPADLYDTPTGGWKDFTFTYRVE